MFWFVAIKWHSVTGGEDGLLNIRAAARCSSASSSVRPAAATRRCSTSASRCSRSSWSGCGGWSIRRSAACCTAIKQNETRAAFVGYNVWLYKWLAFTLSAAIAGLAGALFAMAQQSAYPNVMSLHSSGFVVMMVLIGGGLVSFWGPVIGAVFFILARDLLGATTETWLLWYGLLFMAMVLCKPEGIAGLWQAMASPGVGAQARHAALPQRRGSRMALFEAHRPAQALRRPGRAAGRHLAFEEGRLSGIMGPNGAGKTTCFNVLTGRYAPDRGRVRFAGEDITGLPPRRIARQGHLALVPGDEPVRRLQRARQRAGRAAGGARARASTSSRDLGADRAAQDEAAAVLARVGLAGKEHAPAQGLSYGERRALEIAVALAAQPRLLFLDEPTAGLGAEATERLADLDRRAEARSSRS